VETGGGGEWSATGLGGSMECGTLGGGADWDGNKIWSVKIINK